MTQTTSAESASKQELTTQPKQEVTVKTFFSREDVKGKFLEVIGDKQKSSAFMGAVLSVINSNAKLKDATPQSVYMCAMMAATLNLQVHPSLGQAYIVPYKNNSTGVTEAQFQVGVKGYKQLAIRSGQFRTITDAEVFEGQLISENPLTGFEFDWTKKKSEKVIGYVSYFELLNGFKSTYYMSVEKVTEHAKKYSKTFSYETSSWKKDFKGMALKTVTKQNISKYAPLSVEMQKAVIADQAVIKDAETMDVSYEDAGKAEITNEELQVLFTEKKGKMKVSDARNAERIIGEMETESYQKLKTELEAIA